MKTVFIYALKCPVTKRIRYVGATIIPTRRLSHHCCGARKGGKNHRECWIRSLLAKELKPDMEILDEVPESEWQQWEVAYIEHFRESGCDLVNATPGGDCGPILRGKDSPRFGKKNSSEHCKRMSGPRSSIVGARNPFFGRKHTDETRKLMRENHADVSGKKNPNLGKKLPNNSSGFVGVCWRADNKKWRAFIGVKTKRVGLGDYSDIADAVFVRNLAMDKYYGGPRV